MTNARRVIVILFTALICVLAFYGNNRSFWSDETYSVYAATTDLATLIRESRMDVHTPFYYILLKGWIAMFGTAEIAVRGFSVLFYFASIAALYFAGERLFGIKVALAAAAIWAVSPLAIIDAHFARMYTLLSFCCILSLWLYLELLLNRKWGWHLFGFGVVTAIGIFLHVWFLFLVFAQLVCGVIFQPRLFVKRITPVMALSGAPYAFLWFPLFIKQADYAREAMYWVGSPGAEDLWWVAAFFGGLGWIVIVSVILSRAVRSSARNPAAAPLTVLLAVSLLVPFLISQLKPIFFFRYTVIALPMFALLLGILFAGMKTRTWIAALVLIAVLNGSLMVTAINNASSPDCSDKGLAQDLADQSGDSDVFIYTTVSKLTIEYYLPKEKRLTSFCLPVGLLAHPGYIGDVDSVPDSDVKDVAKAAEEALARSPSSTLWVVFGKHERLNQQLEAQLQESDFAPIDERRFDCRTINDLNVIHFQSVKTYRRIVR